MAFHSYRTNVDTWTKTWRKEMDNYELVALEMSSTHVTEHWKAKPEPEPPVLKPNEPELPAMKKPAVSKGVLKKPASSRRAFQRATEKKAAAVTARPAKETAKAKAKAKASKTSEHYSTQAYWAVFR